MLFLCGLLRPNLKARGEHPTSQKTWAAAWLLVTRICSVYLVDEFSHCVLWPLLIKLMVVLFDVFLDGEYGFTSMGSWRYSRGWAFVVLFDLFLDGEYGFTSFGSWCYSRGWVWNLGTMVCCIASGKWNVSRVSLQGFDLSYLIF